eukprot:6173174-Pleurochrysis_carterae.AAC.3
MPSQVAKPLPRRPRKWPHSRACAPVARLHFRTTNNHLTHTRDLPGMHFAPPLDSPIRALDPP